MLGLVLDVSLDQGEVLVGRLGALGRLDGSGGRGGSVNSGGVAVVV